MKEKIGEKHEKTSGMKENGIEAINIENRHVKISMAIMAKNGMKRRDMGVAA